MKIKEARVPPGCCDPYGDVTMAADPYREALYSLPSSLDATAQGWWDEREGFQRAAPKRQKISFFPFYFLSCIAILFQLCLILRVLSYSGDSQNHISRLARARSLTR